MAQEQRFELVSTLGRGGMAEVFLGWMHSVGGLRRKVAIKRILPELIQKQSKLFQQMFVDEARLAFQLEHDNIVRVYDVGQTSNTFFIVMEYIEGFDLKSVMEKLRTNNTIFPLGVAIYITLQVCAGLGYAHSLTDAEGKPLGLIHNDISPPNILIGRHGEVKVADFGLSDARSNDVSTPEGMIKGKFAYISPESTKNPPAITSRSDIFSIGICLWEMLAGRRLFQRSTDIETFKAVKACVIPDIRRIRNDIPDELLKVLYKALAPHPDDRYQTCESLYLDLASVATALAIPINRFDLSWIVNDLADNRWSEFGGEKVSEAMQKTLQDELGGMLPPGDAEILGEIVTGVSVAIDVKSSEQAIAQNANWLNDVFDEVGFEDGAVVFTDKEKDKEKQDATKASDTSNPSANGPKTAAEIAAQEVTQDSPTRRINDILPSSKSVLISRTSMISGPHRHLRSACYVLLGLIIGAIATLALVMLHIIDV